jgi:hypothetical protein
VSDARARILTAWLGVIFGAGGTLICITDVSPESWTLTAEVVHLEARGALGSFRFSRLPTAVYAFRASLSAERTLGDASTHALGVDAGFDPGAAFVALLDERAIAWIGRSDTGERP